MSSILTQRCIENHVFSEIVGWVVYYPFRKTPGFFPSGLHILAFQQNNQKFILPTIDQFFNWRCQTRTSVGSDAGFYATPALQKHLVCVLPSQNVFEDLTSSVLEFLFKVVSAVIDLRWDYFSELCVFHGKHAEYSQIFCCWYVVDVW